MDRRGIQGIAIDTLEASVRADELRDWLTGTPISLLQGIEDLAACDPVRRFYAILDLERPLRLVIKSPDFDRLGRPRGGGHDQGVILALHGAGGHADSAVCKPSDDGDGGPREEVDAIHIPRRGHRVVEGPGRD